MKTTTGPRSVKFKSDNDTFEVCFSEKLTPGVIWFELNDETIAIDRKQASQIVETLIEWLNHSSLTRTA